MTGLCPIKSIMPYSPQVLKEHYFTRSYFTKDRWASYWYQLEMVLQCSPRTLLEIGPGDHTVSDTLEKRGIAVTTADIAKDLFPKVIASVTDLPFGEDSFDAVLAAEVLEHIGFEDVPRALREMRRVTKRFLFIGLPHAGIVFSCGFKLPLFRRFDCIWKLPFFWKKHRFQGEHHWELGKRGYGISRIRKLFVEQGFVVRAARLHADDPAHYFFILEKRQ